MATLAELERALAAADAAGNAEDARALAGAIRQATAGGAAPPAPAQPEAIGWGEALKRGAGRFLPNVGEMALGLGEMAAAANPVQQLTNVVLPERYKPDWQKRGEAGLQALGDIPAGALRNAAQRMLPPEVFKAIDAANPEAGARASAIASELAKRYGKYGSEAGIQELIATEPAGVLADISGIASLAGKGAQAANLARTAQVASRVAAATDPFRPVLAAGGAMARGAGNLRDWFSSERTAANALLAAQAQPGEIVNAMRATQGMPVAGGARPGMTERMVEAGVPNPAVARLEAGLADVATPAGREAFMLQQDRVARLEASLAGVEAQMQQQAAAMTPQQTAQLKTVRDSLLQNLAVERAALEQQGARVAGMLPDTGQAAPGQAIQGRGETMATQFARERVQPAFEAAFAADAATPSIDLSRPMNSAAQLIGEMGAIVDPSSVSPAVRNMLRIEPFEPALNVAPVVSLQDFQVIRSALNSQLRAAERVDLQRAGAIRNVIRQMDTALETSGVPAEARQLYAQARQLVREEQVPRFRTGETGKMLTEGAFNMPRTLPSETVPAFLKTEEGAAQFVRTFQRDPQAVQSMRTGVADWLREASIDPATGFLNPQRMEKFLTDYGRQLGTLDAGSGTALQPVLNQLRQEAARVETNLAALAKDTSRMKKPQNARELVDAAIKSPAEMDFIRQRLSASAREALAQEIQNRALNLIKAGDPQAALDFLTQSRKAVLAGLGEGGAKTVADMTKLAKAQLELQALQSTAPKAKGGAIAPVPDNLTPADMTTIANDIRRLKETGELQAAPTSKTGAVRRAGTEAAEEIGLTPTPHTIGGPITILRNVMARFERKLNSKTAAKLVDFMVKDPDAAIAALEAQAARKATRETATRAPSQSRVPAMLAAPVNALSNTPTQQNRMRELIIR